MRRTTKYVWPFPQLRRGMQVDLYIPAYFYSHEAMARPEVMA